MENRDVAQPADAVLQAIEQVWLKGTVPAEPLPDDWETNNRLKKMIAEMLAVQQLALAMANGDLFQPLQVKGTMAGALKALQANLRHLTWQTQMIAQGDFSQRVDFMGEFSESFNSMVQSLDEARRQLQERERELAAMNAKLLDEIAERKHTEEQLRESEELYRSIINASPDNITITDLQGTILLISPAATEMLGYASTEEIIGKSVIELVAPENRAQAANGVRKMAQNEQGMLTEYRGVRKDGSTFPSEVNGSAIRGADGKPNKLIFIARDVTERKQAEKAIRQANEHLQTQLAEIQALQVQLREQAIRDPLTHLFNRRYLQETLVRELASAQREHAALAVILLDIDRFKRINDAHGHQAGDLMLQSLATLLRDNTRQMDVACRYGGEEFVVVMPGASLNAAHSRAEHLRALVEQLRVEYDALCLQTTLSLGVAAFPQHGGTGDDLMRAADDALYEAKSAGRNRVITAR